MMRTLVEWIVGERMPADTGAMGFVFERPMPGWAWFLVVIAAMAIGVWSYRRLSGSTNRTTRAMRGFLAGVRASVLVLAALLISGPSVRFERMRVERDRVEMLVDRSRSLAIEDAPAQGGARTSRDAQLSSLLAAARPTLDEIARAKELDYVGFAAGAFSLATEASGPVLGEPTGERTDLDGAIRQSLARAAGRPVSAIVVYSDGRSATPVSPDTLRMLERDSVPVFTVALGADERVGDAAIVSSTVPPRAFVRDRVPVEVRVDRGGIAGKLEVRLVDVATGGELARREVPQVDGASGEQSVVLDGSFDAAGARTWRVELVSERADLVRENDARESSVEFIDRALRVLYVEGTSRWEYRYLKNLLLREKDVDSSIMLLSADRDFAQEGNMPIARLPRTKEEFAKYDLFILGDVPSGFFSPEQLTVIRGEVGERGAGLLWIAGERSTPASWDGTALADLFPFRPPLALETRAGLSMMKPTDAATRLGLLRLSDDDDGWPDVFTDDALSWPRLRYMQSLPRAKLKPTAEVLAEAEGSGAAAEEPSAAIARMRFGAGEVVFVATDEIWRWRYGQGERYPERFWVPIVRLLARESIVQDDARAVLTASPARVAPGDSVMLSLRIADEETARQSPQVVPVEIRAADGTPVARVDLPRDGGEATAAFPTERAGAFEAVAEDPAFGRVSAAFEVVRQDDELRRGDTDHAALADLARRTGGRVLDAASFATLPSLLPQRARETDESISRTLWDTPFALAMLLVLLGIEWTGRRMLRLV